MGFLWNYVFTIIMLYFLLGWTELNIRRVNKGDRLMSMFTEDDEFYAYGKKLSNTNMGIIMVKLIMVTTIVAAFWY